AAALCAGGSDGSKRGLDDATFHQRFTPRRKASLWAQRNVGLGGALGEPGRMRPRGQADFDGAKSDGRWDRA
ncbi:YdeI/OmpD-associated family protein, partial [Curtobacterium sp. PsM8]|uniref:YdeI/OmpD-associated family protein n=1 Tax=Curtobacterium sp. PsM8 TaxID=3030532 RepID=UPI00263CB0D1|nr:hypothetical protein [Curtobacterium sp. PsM8]